MIVRRLLAIALAVAGTNAICQPAPQDKTAAPTCDFSEVYNPDGWTIPGLEGATQKTRAAVNDKPGYFVSFRIRIASDRSRPGRVVLRPLVNCRRTRIFRKSPKRVSRE
jgi:hypothetical protein